jgi:mannose-1-phosphate guanylyltransferase/mannose-6-phosphate isomerase
MAARIQPVVLCGGSGTRLWPLSREIFPKQFVPLIEGKSLLGMTLERISALGSPICIANEAHRFLVEDELKKSSPKNIQETNQNVQIFLEPVGRNTAAAIAASLYLPGIENQDLLLFLPADHFIPDAQRFVETIQSGASLAQEGYIVTFGIEPTFPSTGYGYLKKGKALISPGFFVEQFVEKPNAEKAEEMIFSGSFLWNAGIFLARRDVLLEALGKFAPDILASVESSMEECQFDQSFIRPNQELFKKVRSESIDYAVMENFERIAVVPYSGTWSDVGGWNAVASFTPKDVDGNRIVGNGVLVSTTNTYIHATERPVVALGVNDLVIIDTPDAVLVADNAQLENIKNVVEQLKHKEVVQAVVHRKVVRPWGWYDSIDQGDRFQVKRICVKPGGSLSLQLHECRAEHWIVVKGVAKVTNGDQVFFLKENQSTYIPIGVKHRLENLEKIDLEMIEVQSGNYLGEDDIVRFEDSYGRLS